MNKRLPIRFWLETSLAAATGLLSIITLLWRDWIELAFRVDLDANSGALEWLIVGVLLLLTVLFAVLARSEWRRMRTAQAQ